MLLLSLFCSLPSLLPWLSFLPSPELRVVLTAQCSGVERSGQLWVWNPISTQQPCARHNSYGTQAGEFWLPARLSDSKIERPLLQWDRGRKKGRGEKVSAEEYNESMEKVEKDWEWWGRNAAEKMSQCYDLTVRLSMKINYESHFTINLYHLNELS